MEAEPKRKVPPGNQTIIWARKAEPGRGCGVAAWDGMWLKTEYSPAVEGSHVYTLARACTVLAEVQPFVLFLRAAVHGGDLQP